MHEHFKFVISLLLCLLPINQACLISSENLRTTNSMETFLNSCKDSDAWEVTCSKQYWALEEGDLSNCGLSILVINNCITDIGENTFNTALSPDEPFNYGPVILLRDSSEANPPALTNLNLHKNYLTELKRGAFSSNLEKLEYLSLPNNSVSNIEDGTFSKMKLLRSLVLKNNMLTNFIPDKIFSHSMEYLIFLDLRSNFLTELSADTFKGLTALKRLYVSDNRISVIRPRTFEATSKLSELSLAGNFLTNLPGSIFPRDGLQQLSHLYIGNNRLTYLKPNIRSRLNALEELEIGGNPWQCRCLDFIFEWMTVNRISYSYCDKIYLDDGEKPICVWEKNVGDGCTYKFSPYFYLEYSKIMESYPKLERSIFCP